MRHPRTTIAALTLSASALVGIALHEGYMESAYVPVAKDKVTIGYGATKGVKAGDKTTPDRALVTLLENVNSHSEGIKQCIDVPLYQHEFDAYSSFAFNVGVGAFCKSTLVKKLNQSDYIGACNELSKWVYSGGVKYQGLVKRREAERKLCLGED